jgi:hypothetical protein
MPMLVHIADARNTRGIAKTKIKGNKRRVPTKQGFVELRNAVYCMPVLKDYFTSHQWLRELKRDGTRTMVGVYFRLHSEEKIWFGRYNEPHFEMPLGEAIKRVMERKDALGFEIIVPRSIDGKEIHRVKPLPQLLGWRFYPKAHGRKPCLCRGCIGRGEIKSKRLREKGKALGEY